MTQSEGNTSTRWVRIRKWLRKLERALNYWSESFTIFSGRASRIHFYEARERYNSLKSIIEHNAKKLNIALPDIDDFSSPEEAYEYSIKECSELNLQGSELDKCITLFTSWKILMSRSRFISRKPDHLNNLWRTMTQVRIMLMESEFLGTNPARHLYFCKEEAYRLGVRNDPEVKEMIERLGEEITPNAPQGPQFICLYRALLERFNTIRTGRIHQQYINVKIYTRALVMLVVFSMPLLKYGDSLLKFDGSDNILPFIFYGGFLGGLFSVAMRERPRDRAPGDDAYQTRYIITKPFMGAVGAVFLYILIVGEFINTKLIEDLSRLETPGALTFGFSFISGFTERLVFPSFH